MNTWTILEVTDYELKVLRFSEAKGGEAVLESAGTVVFGDLGRDDAGRRERLDRVRKAFGKTAGKRFAAGDAAVLIPKQHCIGREVRLPSGNAEEIAGMVPFEAQKFIPFNVERHVVSHEVVRLDAIQGSDVILAATEDSVIGEALELCAAAGCDPIVANVSSLALGQAFLATHGAEATQEPVLLLHVGTVHTELTILHLGSIAATRSVLHGLTSLHRALSGQGTGGESLEAVPKLEAMDLPALLALDLNSPEDFVSIGEARATSAGPAARAWVQKLLTNIRRTVEHSQRERELPTISRIYLTGEGAMLRGLSEALSVNLGVPVELFDPMAEVKRAGTAAAERTPTLPYANGWGALLRLRDMAVERDDSAATINLLPPQVIERQRKAQARVVLSLTGALVLIAAIMGYLYFAGERNFQEQKAAILEGQISQMKPFVDQVKEKEKHIKIIQSIRSGGGSALQILDRISAYPKVGSTTNGGRLSLTDFKYFAGKEVTVEGESLTVEDINEFVSYLDGLEVDEQKLFASVVTKSQTTVKLPGRDATVRKFQILATFPTARSN